MASVTLFFPSKTLHFSHSTLSFTKLPTRNQTTSLPFKTHADRITTTSITSSISTQNPISDEQKENNQKESREVLKNSKIFVGNLPFDADEEKLASLFGKAGVVEDAKVIYDRETEQSRGFGFVTMSSTEEANKAIEMFNNYELDGRPLTVNNASARGSKPLRIGSDSGSGHLIYVGNLPREVDSTLLEEIFRDYGKVLDTRVIYDRESGQSRGFGFVKMSIDCKVDEVIAALDGRSMDGRPLRVNVAEQKS